MKDTVFVQAARSNIFHICDTVAEKDGGDYYHKTRCNRRLKNVYQIRFPARTTGSQCNQCGENEDYKQVNSILHKRARAVRQRELNRYNLENEQREQAAPEIAAALESLGWTVSIERLARGVVLTGERGVLNFEMRL